VDATPVCSRKQPACRQRPSLRRLLLALGAALALAPGAAWALSSGATIDVNDSATASGTGWAYAAGVFTVTGDVTITGTGVATDNRIVVTGAPRYITLGDGVNIDASATSGACAFDISGATVFLTLTGANTLTSGYGCAGLHVPDGARLTMDGAGALTVKGGENGAGIGGSDGESGGSITINSGTITADSGFFDTGVGAGIGGGSGGAGGVITINGGDVVVDFGGAGIGGGLQGDGGYITITGGKVTANGFDGANIGGGNGGNGGTIVISGSADVTASNPSNYSSSAGIGGGMFGEGGNITITGAAKVNATGGDPAAPIGCGAGIGSGATYDTVPVPAGTIKISDIGNVQANYCLAWPIFNAGARIGQGGYLWEPGNEVGYSDPINWRSVTVTQTTGGTIAPFPAASSVPEGANQTFLITPAPGYRIESVTVDGVTYTGAFTDWTMAGITSNTRTITAKFAPLIAPATLAAVPTLNPATLVMLTLTLLLLTGLNRKRRG